MILHLKPPIKQQSYAEISQHFNVCFSFAKFDGEDIIPLFTPVKCRDFLGDAIIKVKANALGGCIYGFNFGNYLKQMDLKHTVVTVYIPSTSGPIEQCKANIKYILHTIEKKAKLRRTKIYDTNKTDVIVLKSSGQWMHPLYISLYTMLVRLGCRGYDITQYNDDNWLESLLNKGALSVLDNDYGYLKNAIIPALSNKVHTDFTNFVYTIMSSTVRKQMHKIPYTEIVNLPIHEIHDYHGIQSFVLTLASTLSHNKAPTLPFNKPAAYLVHAYKEATNGT